MLKRARPRLTLLYPVLAVLVAAGFLLLVALSVAIQPPDARPNQSIGGVLAWARAILFSAGALAFLAGLVALARAEPGEPVAEVEDEPDAPAPPTPVSTLPRSVRVPHTVPIRFTLVALTRDGRQMRAIADYPDARDLMAALVTWREEYPDEQVRVFGPTGEEIARRQAAPKPVVSFARRGRAPAGRRAGLAAGGA
jgi:hypothetical protein